MQIGIEEALVVPEVEVGLGSIVQDEHLAVLERIHRARVDVDVRIELLEDDLEPARGEESAEGGGGDALPESGGDSTRDEDVLRSLPSPRDPTVAEVRRAVACGGSTTLVDRVARRPACVHVTAWRERAASASSSSACEGAVLGTLETGEHA